MAKVSPPKKSTTVEKKERCLLYKLAIAEGGGVDGDEVVDE
jgi:hypothetical protein